MTVSDLKRTWVPVALLVLLPALACARTATPFSPDEPVWQPVSGWDDSTGLFRAGDVPADYNPWILTLGRSVYAEQAVQDALAAFHWYTQESAFGLLSAERAVVHAYDSA